MADTVSVCVLVREQGLQRRRQSAGTDKGGGRNIPPARAACTSSHFHPLGCRQLEDTLQEEIVPSAKPPWILSEAPLGPLSLLQSGPGAARTLCIWSCLGQPQPLLPIFHQREAAEERRTGRWVCSSAG
ncbi:unnamed protein product [Pleuronectes platessa]|uniref:Uncharacterized protein n=1 Tax=Pleuronectes platessa TaxID=8262 RepID=A0A9N7VR45_PLEPL|nr:unnamed protein product [Pleuronectes platessa]